MRYSIIATLTVHPGTVLGLSDEQARRREHAVRRIGRGRFEVIAATQFKRGEVIECDEALPKALAELVEPARRAPRASKPEGGEGATSAPSGPTNGEAAGAPEGAEGGAVAGS